MSSTESPLVELVRSAQAGDDLAFSRLYKTYSAAAYAVILRRVSGPAAEDLVHDVFVTALSRLPQLREPESFPGWLMTIARNSALDHLRRPRVAGSDALPERVAPEDAARRLEAERMLNVIRELPEAYSETLLMRFTQGMTGPEIAARTGLTPGSVRVNLNRGMKLLRARLALRGDRV